MVEAQPVSVEKRSVGRQRGPLPTIAGVAHQGVADGGQVDPHLVGPAGLQPALDERVVTQLLDDPKLKGKQ